MEKRRHEFRSQNSGMLRDTVSCPCEDCNRLRTEDRTAAIARYAAERGLAVSAGERAPITHARIEQIAAKIRKNRIAYEEKGFVPGEQE